MTWLQLVICIIVILFSGQKVAIYGDIIAERTGLGRVWLGVIALALITSLPELFTGISAATLIKAPDLAVGDLLGANAFNMFNLALLDISHRHGSLFAMASPAHRLTGWFSLLLVFIVAISLLINTAGFNMPLGWIGWYTPAIIVLYGFSIRKIFYYEKQHPVSQELKILETGQSSRIVYLYFSLAALFIVGSGIWLASIGDEIARITGLGHSFVGSLFLAFATTLPELTVSFSAMRMGAKDLAIANMIGSNLFNMLILPVIDIIYTREPILTNVSGNHLVTAVGVIILTLLFILGLRFPPVRFFRLSWLNVAVILIFLGVTYYGFVLA